MLVGNFTKIHNVSKMNLRHVTIDSQLFIKCVGNYMYSTCTCTLCVCVCVCVCVYRYGCTKFRSMKQILYLFTMFKTRHRISLPYHPQTNCLVERLILTHQRLMVTFVNQNWTVFAYRSSQQRWSMYTLLLLSGCIK